MALIQLSCMATVASTSPSHPTTGKRGTCLAFRHVVDHLHAVEGNQSIVYYIMFLIYLVTYFLLVVFTKRQDYVLPHAFLVRNFGIITR